MTAIYRVVLNHEANGWGWGPEDIEAATPADAIANAQQRAADEFSFKTYSTMTTDWTPAAAPEVVG